MLATDKPETHNGHQPKSRGFFTPRIPVPVPPVTVIPGSAVPSAEVMKIAGALRSLAAPARHSSDFRSIIWFGEVCTFTALQAAIVRQLWEAWEQGTPQIGGETLLEKAGAVREEYRMDKIFKRHPAWGTFVVSGSTKGSYRLCEPECSKGENLNGELLKIARRILALAARVRHSPDFCSVVWFDTPYSFTPSQAAVVRVLWAAWENGTPDVRQETLLEEARCLSRRLANVFRGNTAWGRMIVRSPKVKGAYRLAKPEE